MQLRLEPRLRRLARLGANVRSGDAPPAEGTEAETLGELAASIGWLFVGGLILVALLAASALSAGVALYGIGWLLDLLLERMPGWVVRHVT
jgi:hypothetical protein